MRVHEAPRFTADVYYFAEGPETYRVEVAVSLCQDDLQFVKRKGRFLARYDLTVIAKDRKGKRVAGDQVRRSRWVDTYEATNATDPCPVETLLLKLCPGQYVVLVRVRDVDSESESAAEQRIVLPPTDEGTWLSGCQFLRGGPAVRGELSGQDPVEVGRTYGDSLPVMRAYVELYGADGAPEPVDVAFEVLDIEGRIAGQGSARAVREHGFGDGYLVEHPTDSLTIGAYDLKVMAERAGDVLAVACGRFRVVSSKVLWGRDFRETLDLLSYIATADELDALEDAPEEERGRAWDEFWAGRDPTPETSRNEVREEFFERVNYANQNFAEPLAEGWQTDRGRIYVTEGPPDRIESHPMELSTYAWEAWYYHRRGITYIFADRNGFGNYVLVGVR